MITSIDLIAAHMVGDYVLQTDGMAKMKLWVSSSSALGHKSLPLIVHGHTKNGNSRLVVPICDDMLLESYKRERSYAESNQ